MANPIWKDFYVNLGTADSVQFRILDDDVVIYAGTSHKRPGHAVNKIRINDICADYILTEFPQLGNDFVGHVLSRYVVEILTDGAYQYCDDAEFYCNWSNDYQFNPLEKGLNCPVNGKVSPLTPIPYSLLHAHEMELESEKTGIIWYQSPNVIGACGTYMVDINNLPSGDVVRLGEQEVEKSSVYKVVDSCHDYALYYRNAYGGVDLLLIEGNHAESDNLTRHTREIEYDNNIISNRGKANYVNEISKTMTLHTSWLTDEESSRMHHLFNSTEVYLFDIVNQKMIPVLLTNTTTEYKTYKGNGGKLVNYAIEVAIAQEMIRR